MKFLVIWFCINSLLAFWLVGCLLLLDCFVFVVVCGLLILLFSAVCFLICGLVLH